MSHLWIQMRHYGAHHGVDPLIFAALYFARLPLLLFSLGLLARRVRSRQPAASVAVAFLALGIFPYTYIFVFGRNLPLWFMAAVVAVAGLTILQGVRKLRRSFQADIDSPIGVTSERSALPTTPIS